MTGHDEGADLPDRPANDWNPRSPEVLAHQLSAYDNMRGRCPVAHSDDLGWSVFRHEDVLAVVTDHETYSSAVSADHPAVPSGYDPPQHTAYRRINDRYFTPEHMARFEPVCREVAAGLIDALPRGTEVEFIGAFAREFALEAQCAWLDWPDTTRDALRHWMERNHRATLERDRDAMAQVAADFDAAVGEIVAARRASPREHDVTTALIGETVEGRLLNDDEVVSILRNWTAGELGTITASVGIVAEYLARNPELQDALRTSPAALRPAIDEMLRIHPPLIANRRVTTREVELAGRTIGASERVAVFWASANRDEAVFGDPDAYDPVGNAPHNVLYGRGIHDCPGAPLARLELEVAARELLARASRIELVPEREPSRAVYPGSGFAALPLRLT